MCPTNSVKSEWSEEMRASEAGSLKHTHVIGYEDSRCQNNKGNNNSFVIREVPMRRMNREAQCGTYNNASRDIPGFCKGKSFCSVETVMMDYDTPELVVFLQEDREVSTRGKRVIQDCAELESNSESYEGSTETMSSISSGSESASRNHCIEDMSVTEKCGFGNLMMMMVEGEEDTTLQTLEEVVNEEEEFSRTFNNWQIDSFTHTIGSKMESPHYAGHYAETSTSFRPEKGNSQSTNVDGEDNRRESSCCAVGTSCTVPATTRRTKSGSVSHQSSDSISSAHSFTFPVLPTEWTGSPVRMAEAERTSQSRRHRWRNIFFPCCKV